MRHYYEVKKTLFDRNNKIYPDNYIWTERPASVSALCLSGHLEQSRIVTPSASCRWCNSNEYWLNYRKLFICKKCYPPQSFPDEEMQRVYDTYTVEKDKE